MKLARLIREVPEIVPQAPLPGGLSIRGLEHDSRRVKPGFLFASLPSASGKASDSAAYVREALRRGASAVLAGGEGPGRGRTAWLRAADPRGAYARLCSAYFGHPSRSLLLAGVTGTNGKTTSTYLLRSIFERAGRPCAVLGTVGYWTGARMLPAPNTTPSALELQALLRRALRDGARAAAMEASSHALDQGRAEGLDFDAAVFTNLTRDHLDYHGTMARYLKAKARLFEMLGSSAKAAPVAVLNADDPRSRALARRVPGRARLVFTALGPGRAEVRAEKLRLSAGASRFRLRLGGRALEMELPLPGRFNVSNALGAAAAAWALGLPESAIARGLREPLLPPGRMEKVEAGQPFSVLVDYAHTPDALERVLRTVDEFARGRVITVFGCGGDRDRGKRPRMGAIAHRLSDLVVVTSDNPRTEDPEAIIAEVLRGVPGERGKARRVLALADRRQAIQRALKVARPGDVVLLAGKGHEDTQVVGERKLPFDDRVVARKYLEGMYGGGKRGSLA